MGVTDRYLEKQALYGPLVDAPPSDGLFTAIVIPCHDEDRLPDTLESLRLCEPTRYPVEVLVVINEAASAGEAVVRRNDDTFREASRWADRHACRLRAFRIIRLPGLPDKHAGVGLARKIGMDEAVRRLGASGRDGAIVCLDADCTVDPDYLAELESLFLAHPDATGCSIYFEHPLEGEAFPPEVYKGIRDYELFLRYYKNALDWCGFPYPYHTVGSSMAVRCSAYARQGGMNRRRAGEDFYFLHKIFPLGHFYELDTTRVIPSPRPSHRVPFGTGRAIRRHLDAGGAAFPAYDPRTFGDLKALFDTVPALYRPAGHGLSWPEPVSAFLATQDFENKLRELRGNSASERAFVKRFFNWFDGFRVLKYVHFATENHYPKIPLEKAVRAFQRLDPGIAPHARSEKELLEGYRSIDASKGIATIPDPGQER